MSSTVAIKQTNKITGPNRASMYSTTPGGTPRTFYTREQLLSLASSPLSQSPPIGFQIPAVISRSPALADQQSRFKHSEPCINVEQDLHAQRDHHNDEDDDDHDDHDEGEEQDAGFDLEL
ncbi:uncharacterized protein MEPE_05147 [Melanopsichium pennsylvanicum]|uniref:Uncharacterized protein n=1 Tax=Melanopsichium pennsylvanicum TaxID=63383 RepID=A0AAJ4XST4_9BASI|nr:uncharacterized protein MEPE_05147 [Melanopsichium pennsylvanicum]